MPRKDQRPTRPCSADSSRKEGPSPRSLRYAETGVSVSATNVWRRGTRVCSRASSRTSSRLGERSSSAVSAATAIEHVEGVGHPETARGQQHLEVVEHVGGLLRQALVALVFGRLGGLLGLLAHLGP